MDSKPLKTLLSFLFVLAMVFCIPAGFARTTGEILEELNSLPPSERQKRLESEARKEGKFLSYGALQADEEKAIFNAFMAQYPFIEAKHWCSGVSRAMDRVLLEQRAGRVIADVMIGGTGEVYELKRRHAVARYLSPSAKLFSPELKDKDGFWVALGLSPNIIAYNREMVSHAEAPKGYLDLLDPRWKGKISLDVEPDILVHGLIVDWGEAKTKDFLLKLASQDLALRDGRSLRLQLLCAGEFVVSPDLYAHHTVDALRRGCPVQVIYPQPTFASVSPIVMIEGAPHPHAAALFYDFLLSKEGMNLYKVAGRIPTHPEVEPKYSELHQLGRKAMIRTLKPEVIGPNRDKMYRLLHETILKKRR